MRKNIYLLLGASSDIGKSYLNSLELDERNHMVILQYHSSKEELEGLCSILKYCKVDMIQCDLSDKENVKSMIVYIQKKYCAPTHILHMAADKLEYLKYKNTDFQMIMYDFEVQIHSIFEIMKAFLSNMSSERYGKVVFLLSSCTIGAPPKYMSAYVVVKYALLGLMKSLASEYGGKGININGISPSTIETKFLSRIDQRTIDMIAMNMPMKRNIEISEVVQGIRFLMSEDSSYMNGVNLNLSGGSKM